MDYKHIDTTDKIIRAFYTVYNALGYGFLEKVYRNAMLIELRKQGMVVTPEAPITVYYDSKAVGECFADLLIHETVIVELKAASRLVDKNEAQLLNYLKSTHYEVGLLLNFGPKPEIRRKAFDNSRKGSMNWTQMNAEKR
ncbi:MAG: GxxExxY protein [Desulfobacteraceae bacterium]|nr:GxxExxY protein [Desulfobacteraceae bacterium]